MSIEGTGVLLPLRNLGNFFHPILSFGRDTKIRWNHGRGVCGRVSKRYPTQGNRKTTGLVRITGVTGGGGAKEENAPSGTFFLGGGTLGILFYLSNIHTYLYFVVYTNYERIAVT